MENNTELQTQVVEQTNTGMVETEPQSTQEPKMVSMTQEQLDELISKRLMRQEKKFEEKISALQEAQKLQAMSEQEKAEYEYAKRLSDLEAREQAIQEREDAYNKQKYQTEIQRQLKEAHLPDVSDLLVGLDAESVKAKIDSMKESFNMQMNTQIEAKVQASANTPTVPSEQAKPLTMDDIAKMSPQEIMKHKSEVDRAFKEYYQTK